MAAVLSPLHRIPVEIQMEIVCFAPRRAHVALMATSRFLKAITEPFMYEEVYIGRKGVKALVCLLEQEETLRRMVKRLTLCASCVWYHKDISCATLVAIGRVVPKLVNLEVLRYDGGAVIAGTLPLFPNLELVDWLPSLWNQPRGIMHMATSGTILECDQAWSNLRFVELEAFYVKDCLSCVTHLETLSLLPALGPFPTELIDGSLDGLGGSLRALYGSKHAIYMMLGVPGFGANLRELFVWLREFEKRRTLFPLPRMVRELRHLRRLGCGLIRHGRLPISDDDRCPGYSLAKDAMAMSKLDLFHYCAAEGCLTFMEDGIYRRVGRGSVDGGPDPFCDHAREPRGEWYSHVFQTDNLTLWSGWDVLPAVFEAR